MHPVINAIMMVLFTISVIGLSILALTNPRPLQLMWEGFVGMITQGIYGRGLPKGYPVHDKMIPDEIPAELEPIDYKKLEQDNYKSMVDSWDEQFLRLHRVEDLTREQLLRLSDFDIDEQKRREIYVEVTHRLRKSEKHFANRLERAFRKDPDDTYLSSECARNKHHHCEELGIAGVREPCGCECHDEIDLDDF